ncbi:MAG TPA: hypothetical protein VFA26_08455 [Gemmataceae bacterium]|nr:hypothetical protein [Gemmataceae bacterium]
MPDGQSLQERSPPAACPVCAAPVPADQVSAHLRQAHQLCEFRGVRRPLPDTMAHLLGLVCCPEPDGEAWAVFEKLAAQECGPGTDTFLAASLTQGLKRLGDDRRDTGAAAVAGLLKDNPRGPRLIALLLSQPEPAGRRLAYRLVEALPARLHGANLAALRPLLLDRRQPPEEQLEGAAALLRAVGKDGPAALEVLKVLTAGLGKRRGIERLRQLGERIGPCPALDEVCAELEDQMRMRCPRCGAEGRRREMLAHLWDEHRLVLEGRRVREPWDAIADWVAAHAVSPDPGLLARCRDLAQKLDGEAGLRRVQRLLLARGVPDAQAQAELLAEAEQRDASLCPHCYDFVAIPRIDAPAELSVHRGRLSARGYRVEVSESGLFSRLEVEVPGRPPERLPLPGRRLTRKGALYLLAGPLVLTALALAVLAPKMVAAVALTVTFLLLGALVVALFVQADWRSARPPLERAVDQAWAVLAPRLHAAGFSAADAAFLGGLAALSVGHGRPAARAAVLTRLLNLTDKEVSAHVEAARNLAALHRLALADAVAAGKDPVPLLAGQVGRCFEGRLPLAFADGLLAGWEEAGWPPRKRALLRVLLLDRAFEAGFEVRNLLDAGQTAPALGAVLGTDDPGGLARTRLLWSLRPRRPWDRCGEAVTVFNLAADPEGADLLAKHPDLLLYQPAGWQGSGGDARARGAEVIVCCRGIVFEGTLFDEPVRTVEVIARRGESGESYVLVLGEHRFVFHADPGAIASQLERWFRWYFGDFVPQVKEVYRWHSPHVAAVLRAWGTVPCPGCKRPLLPRAGDVAIALD